jgi:hypothetical protein
MGKSAKISQNALLSNSRVDTEREIDVILKNILRLPWNATME